MTHHSEVGRLLNVAERPTAVDQISDDGLRDWLGMINDRSLSELPGARAALGCRTAEAPGSFDRVV